MVECKVVSEPFMQTARTRARATRRMQVNARQLFATFEDDTAWHRWVPVIRRLEWNSPRPITEGATRTVTLALGVRLEEVFWAWEPDRHMAFCVTRSSTGALRALSESYRITAINDHSCELEWRMAIELNGFMRPAERYMRSSLGPAMEKILATLEAVAADLASTQRQVA